MGAAFGHSRSKITMRRRFRALFAIISTKQATMDETYIHHFTPESNQQSAEWTPAGENRPK